MGRSFGRGGNRGDRIREKRKAHRQKARRIGEVTAREFRRELAVIERQPHRLELVKSGTPVCIQPEETAPITTPAPKPGIISRILSLFGGRQ